MPTHNDCFMEQPVSHLMHEAHQKCQNVDMALLDTSDPCHSIPDCCKCMKRFQCIRLNQMRQADIVDHIFLDHVDFVHIVLYLASGMNNILSFLLSILHAETSHTFYNSWTSCFF